MSIGDFWSVEHLANHPQATYLMQLRGESMREAGILDGDVVLVDRAIAPRSGHIVAAAVVVDREFTIKQLWQRSGRVKLKAAKPDFCGPSPVCRGFTPKA